MDDFESAFDNLFQVAPERFISERDSLVKLLKAQKRRDDASAVAALRRPSPVLWALNQVARLNPEASRRLVALGTAALDAQGALLNGGSAAAVLAIVEQRRLVIGELIATATDALDAIGVLSDGLGPSLRAAYEVVSTDREASGAFVIGQLATLPDRSDDPPSSPTRHLTSVPTGTDVARDSAPPKPQPDEAVAKEAVTKEAVGAAEAVNADLAADDSQIQATRRIEELRRLTAEVEVARTAATRAREEFAEVSVLVFETATSLRDCVAEVAAVSQQIAELETRREQLQSVQQHAEEMAQAAEAQRDEAHSALERSLEIAKVAVRTLDEWQSANAPAGSETLTSTPPSDSGQ